MCAQGDARGFLRRQAKRFVVSVGVQALCTAHDSGHALHRHTHHVVEWLLSGQCCTTGLGVKPHEVAGWVLGPKPFGHDPIPHATTRAEFGDFFEEIIVTIPEKTQARGECINI